MARHSDDEEYSDREVTSRKETRTRRTTSTSKTEKPKKKKPKRPSGGININMSNSNNIGAAPVMPKLAIPATTPEIEEYDDDEDEQERVRVERVTIEAEEKKKRSETRAARRALEEAKKKKVDESESEEEEEEVTTVTKKKKKKQVKETEDETRTITTRTKISEGETEDEEFARRCPHFSWVSSESTKIKQPGAKRALMDSVEVKHGGTLEAWDRSCQAAHNNLALAKGLTLEQYKQRYGRDLADMTLTPILSANNGSGFLFSRTVRGPVFSPTYVIPPIPVFNPVFTYGVGYGAYGGSVMGSQTRMRESVETRTETITSGGRVVEVPEESEEEDIVTKVVKKVKKSKKTES